MRDQLSRYILTENQLKKSIRESMTAYEQWRARIEHARTQGREDLLEGAQSELNQHAAKLAALSGELETLQTELAKVKDQIRQADVRAQGRTSGVDPNALLAGIEAMVGKDSGQAELDRQLQESQADELLDQLKNRLASEKPES